MVYAGLDTIEDVSGPTIVGIDATSGEIRWDTELSGESMRSLQSVGGVVIAEVLVNETESLQEYTITALEPDSGTENWSLGAAYEFG